MADEKEREIVRKGLLEANLRPAKSVRRVEVKEIAFVGWQKTGLHTHPCPLMGLVVEGSARFQVEGKAEKILGAGEAFFEPADTRICILIMRRRRRGRNLWRFICWVRGRRS